MLKVSTQADIQALPQTVPPAIQGYIAQRFTMLHSVYCSNGIPLLGQFSLATHGDILVAESYKDVQDIVFEEVGRTSAEINNALEAAKALLKHDDSSQSVLYEDVTEDMVHDLFRQGYTNLHKGTVPALRRLIETFLERVEVGKTTITVTFKVAVPADTDTPYHHVVQIDRQSLKSSA